MRRIVDYLGLIVLVGAGVFAIRYFQLAEPDGIVTILDGDSLRIKSREFRLFGIDAPEYRQTCQTADGRSYACGKHSRKYLVRLIAGKTVKCRTVDVDRYDREIAICKADQINLNREMVRGGWAVAYLRYSLNYAKPEIEARKAGRGIWQGRFTEPEDWRAEHR
jgi:endonuclease YncB( thermonuclease family)